MASFFPIPESDPTYTSSVNWYGTVRGRLGWSTGPALFYGTAGLAYGSVSVTNFSSVGVLSLYDQTSKVKTGWVAGAGMDYMLRPNLILNVAYQYVDLGSISMASSTVNCCLSQSINAHAQFQVVTVGLSWRFGTTDTARDSMASAMPTKAPAYRAPSNPWEGGYLGGHVGGAWGNKTSATYSSEQPGLLSPVFSDIRLKRDITLVGHISDGLGLYSYRYLWSDTVYVGVMAQEVALMHPKAVVRNDLDGYLRVDYGSLGIKLMTLPEWEAQQAHIVAAQKSL